MRITIFLLLILLLLCPIVLAQDDNENLAVITGGLDWSADGRYIAVATSQGVYIHRTDDLSVVEVVDENLEVHTVEWSHEGYRLAYDDRDGVAVVIYDMETGKRSDINLNRHGEDYGFGTYEIQWSPDDTLLSTGDLNSKNLFIIEVDQARIVDEILILDYIGATPGAIVDWHSDGQYLFVARGGNLVLIWDVSQEQLAWTIKLKNVPDSDFWLTRFDMMKWDSTGTRLAGGWNRIMYVIDAATGEILNTYIQEEFRYFGLSWHPEENKLAFFAQNYGDDIHGMNNGIIVWDISTDEIVEIPGILLADVIYSNNAVEWSPDGSKLASMHSDGKIIIWETENYEVIAEYDGYRNFYSDD